MAIVRIETPDGRTRGWQARAHVAKGHPRLTRLCSDGVCGGKRKARAAAQVEERCASSARRSACAGGSACEDPRATAW